MFWRSPCYSAPERRARSVRKPDVPITQRVQIRGSALRVEKHSGRESLYSTARSNLRTPWGLHGLRRGVATSPGQSPWMGFSALTPYSTARSTFWRARVSTRPGQRPWMGFSALTRSLDASRELSSLHGRSSEISAQRRSIRPLVILALQCSRTGGGAWTWHGLRSDGSAHG